MSTRSVVATPAGDGWRGRYVHCDGYPSARLPELLDLVARDGVEKVADVLTRENYGWSYLSADQGPEIEHDMYKDGRFIAVPGYGLAYTESQAGEGYEHTDTETDPLFIEWVYVLGPKGITVLESYDTGERLSTELGGRPYEMAVYGHRYFGSVAYGDYLAANSLINQYQIGVS